MGGAGESFIAVFAGELTCSNAFDCNLDFDKYGGILLWIFIMVYMFKALGVICDEYFVPSLEVIVEKLQLSNDVAGATFMAAGSSAPELFTNLVATFFIVNEGGVGTIIGSAIFNILVIVGATGIVACKEKKLKIWWYPLCRDCFFYLVSIIELVIFLGDEHVKAWECIVMVTTYVLYCIYMKFNPHIVQALGLVKPVAVETVESLTDIKVIEADRETTPSIASLPSVEYLGNQGTSSVTGGRLSLSPPSGTLNSSLRSSGYVVSEDASKQPDCSGLGTVDADMPEAPSKAIPNGRPSVDSRISHLEPSCSPRQETRRPSWGYAETVQAERRPSKQSNQGIESTGIKNIEKADDGVKENTTLSSDQSDASASVSLCRDPMCIFWEFTMPPAERWGGGLLFSAAIFYIFILTYVMVDSTNRIGTILHIPPLAMALVFLAAGTSIPDALGSIAVAKQGEGDMAVCNALGSNVFDILIGLGIPWIIKTGIMGDEVAFEGKFDELIWDVVVLIGVLFLFVFSLIVQNWYLSRSVGFMLLSVYVLFLIYNVLMVWAFKVKKIDGE